MDDLYNKLRAADGPKFKRGDIVIWRTKGFPDQKVEILKGPAPLGGYAGLKAEPGWLVKLVGGQNDGKRLWAKENDLVPDVAEMTTSGDIAFARGDGMRDPTPEEMAIITGKNLDKRKQAEKKRQYESTLKEQMDARVQQLQNVIADVLDPKAKQLHSNIEAFVRVFGAQRNETPKVMVSYNDPDADIRKMLPASVGELELIYAAIKKRKPLSNYAPFEDYEKIFGARLLSRVDGTTVLYEGFLDHNLVITEQIYIDDVDAAEKVGDTIKSVKVADRHIYPIGGMFNPEVFSQIKDIIQSDEEEEE